MTGENKKIRFGVIGTGNMGEAIVRGFVKGGGAARAEITLFDAYEKKSAALARELGVQTAASLEALIDQSELLLIAIKPNVCTHVFA